MRSAVWLLLSLALVGCDEAPQARERRDPPSVVPHEPRPLDVAPPEPVEPPPEVTEARPEPPWPADLPPMHACRHDRECAYVGPTSPSSPCCDVTGERAVRREWLERVLAHRASGACEGVRCPPLERPSAASHGPGVPGCRGVCRAETCSFVCDVDPTRPP